MMNDLPSHITIPVEILASVFNNTTNSYKYYWFLSILESLQKKNTNEISIEDLCVNMVETVWYPLNFFKLSFGSQDHFRNIADLINSFIDPDNTKDSIIDQVNSKADEITRRQIKTEIRTLARWVPYRFIRPFFRNELRGLPDTQVNSRITELAANWSRQHPERVPYYFKDGKIIINKPWMDYLISHIGLIRGFTYWNLVNFVQKNNPNTMGIPGKLIKPEKRDLTLNTRSWDFYYRDKSGINCIYSRLPVPENFTLDHFVPWSYTIHDLNWNILPVSKEINSSKSNSLPSLELYLNDFLSLQHDFYKSLYSSNFGSKDKILEHYCLLFNESASTVYNMPQIHFQEKLAGTIKPMVQIATNMGFSFGWSYQVK